LVSFSALLCGVRGGNVKTKFLGKPPSAIPKISKLFTAVTFADARK
jgi:hypothetical protein